MKFNTAKARDQLDQTIAQLRRDPAITPKEIARALGISDNTARGYVNEARSRMVERRQGDRRQPAPRPAPPLYATPIFLEL